MDCFVLSLLKCEHLTHNSVSFSSQVSLVFALQLLEKPSSGHDLVQLVFLRYLRHISIIHTHIKCPIRQFIGHFVNNIFRLFSHRFTIMVATLLQRSNLRNTLGLLLYRLDIIFLRDLITGFVEC